MTESSVRNAGGSGADIFKQRSAAPSPRQQPSLLEGSSISLSLCSPSLLCHVHVMFVNAALMLLVRVRLGRHTCMLWLYLTCSLVACVVCGPAFYWGPLCRHNNAPTYACSAPHCILLISSTNHFVSLSSGILLFCE